MAIAKSNGFTLTEFMLALAGSVLLLFAVFFGYRLVKESQDNTTAIQQGSTFVMALENYGASSSDVFPAGTFGYGPGASNTNLSSNLQDLYNYIQNNIGNINDVSIQYACQSNLQTTITPVIPDVNLVKLDTGIITRLHEVNDNNWTCAISNNSVVCTYSQGTCQ
jgi:prepilin-type N-terminal cleavage/methylation domain